MKKIVLEQCAAGCRIRHDPIPSPFGVLGANAKHSGRWINIVGSESAKFFPPQCRIVSKREHRSVANHLPTRDCQNRLPVRIVGNPRQSAVAADDHSTTVVRDGILSTKTFIDKVAVEKPEYG